MSGQSELRAGILAEAESVQRLQDGYCWQFRHARDLLARLGEIIDGERQCCRFLKFAIEADQDDGRVTMTVAGPPGIPEFLESWIA